MCAVSVSIVCIVAIVIVMSDTQNRFLSIAPEKLCCGLRIAVDLRYRCFVQ